MAYSTIDDVFARYPPISTMVGSAANDVTSVEISSVYIADAESIIDVHLARRYTVPVYPEPIITMICSDLAISNMIFEKLGELPGFIQPRYDRAIALLDKLASGDLILSSSSTSIVSTGDNFAWSSTQSYHSIFSPVLEPLDQAVDGDWVTNDKNERSGDG